MVSSVCGKKPRDTHKQNVLTCETIPLAKVMQERNAEC
jgi:hypothetical protein